MKIILFFLIAYLCGSIPFGYIVGKIKGVDLRKTGYKRVGASNVYKSVGFLPSVFVFFADFLKGIAVIIIGKWIGFPEALASIGGIFAIVGHNWPIWLKFKGEGRGVATSCGLVFYLLPRETALLIIIFVVLTVIIKSTPLPFFVFFLLMPFAAMIFKEPRWLILISAIIFGLLVFKRVISNVKSLKDVRIAKSLILFDAIKTNNEINNEKS